MRVPIRGYLSLAFVIISVNLLSFSSGLLFSWSSPVTPKLTSSARLDENPLGHLISDNDISWISSLLPLGAAISPPFLGLPIEKFGRKITLIAISIPYVISAFMLAFAEHIELYFAARLIGGLALGATFTLVPMYVTEMADKEYRGAMGATMNNFVALGMLVSYSIGPYLSIKWFCIVMGMVPIVFLITSIWLPESPFFLVKKGRREEAIKVLTRLRPNTNKIEEEVQEIEGYLQLQSEGKFTDLFTQKLALKCLGISLMLMFFQQLCGVNAILAYTEPIFEESGSSFSPEVSSILFGSVQFSATIFTLFIVDTAGRKILLNISSTGMLITELGLAVYYVLKEDGKNMSGYEWVSVTCMLLFIAVHNLGYAQLPWVVLSEIFADNVRNVATSTTSTIAWLFTFIITVLFTPLSDAIGWSGVFFLFSASNIIAVAMVTLVVPETKGKSLKEIQEALMKKTKKEDLKD